MGGKSRANEDHDNIVEIMVTLDYVKKSLDTGSLKMSELAVRLDEMHKELDALNLWKNKMIGIAVGISSVATVLINFVMRKV